MKHCIFQDDASSTVNTEFMRNYVLLMIVISSLVLVKRQRISGMALMFCLKTCVGFSLTCSIADKARSKPERSSLGSR